MAFDRLFLVQKYAPANGGPEHAEVRDVLRGVRGLGAVTVQVDTAEVLGRIEFGGAVDACVTVRQDTTPSPTGCPVYIPCNVTVGDQVTPIGLYQPITIEIGRVDGDGPA